MEYRPHIGQDRWVDETYGAKQGGYFLDFGAFDGVTISNTYDRGCARLERHLRKAEAVIFCEAVSAEPHRHSDKLCAVEGKQKEIIVRRCPWP